MAIQSEAPSSHSLLQVSAKGTMLQGSKLLHCAMLITPATSRGQGSLCRARGASPGKFHHAQAPKPEEVVQLRSGVANEAYVLRKSPQMKTRVL